MLKTFKTLLIALLTVFSLSLATPALASGELVVQQNGDVMYVTTEIDPATGEQVVVTRPADPAISEIDPPTAFARDIGTLINNVLTFIFIVCSLMVFFYLIWGGLDWITSGGDKGKTEKARNKMVAAIVGLIIVLASYAAVNLIVRFFTANSLNELLQQFSTGPVKGETRLTPAVTPSPTGTPKPSPSATST